MSPCVTSQAVAPVPTVPTVPTGACPYRSLQVLAWLRSLQVLSVTTFPTESFQGHAFGAPADQPWDGTRGMRRASTAKSVDELGEWR
jgi:hypothetical protein